MSMKNGSGYCATTSSESLIVGVIWTVTGSPVSRSIWQSNGSRVDACLATPTRGRAAGGAKPSVACEMQTSASTARTTLWQVRELEPARMQVHVYANMSNAGCVAQVRKSQS